jgi:hypothetical protein
VAIDPSAKSARTVAALRQPDEASGYAPTAARFLRASGEGVAMPPSNRPPLVIAAIALLVGAAVGGVIGRMTGDGPALVQFERRASEGREVAPPIGAAPEPQRIEERAAHDAMDGASAATAATSSGTTTLFLDELRARGRDGIARGWRTVRADEMPAEQLAFGLAEFESTVDTAPGAIGAKLARAANDREASLALGSAAELLKSMKEGHAVDPAIVRDAAHFDALFERKSHAGTADGRAFLKDATEASPELQDGMTLLFPAGIHDTRLDWAVRSAKSFPRDLVISGAGIDQTLLHFDNLLAIGNVVNLTFRDFTFWNDGPLLDLRGDSQSTITLERVRLAGFDNGAGGSNALSLVATAFRATDCVFAGGYGDSPYYGSLLDVRVDGLLARFDRCRFEHLTFWHRARDSWRLLFTDCTFDHVAHSWQNRSKLPPGVEFLPGTPTFGDPVPPGENPPARDLNALFPGWREKLR